MISEELGDDIALIITHMEKVSMDTKNKQATLRAQVEAVEAAKKRGIPIYAAYRQEEGKLNEELEAARGKEQIYDFTGGSGNALVANRRKPPSNQGGFLSDFLGRVSRVIVLGQDIDECVTDTIFGRWVRWVETKYRPGGAADGPYEQGLLDLGKKVITARNVMLPTAKDRQCSSYYEFGRINTRRVESTSGGQLANGTGQSAVPLNAATQAPLKYPSKAPVEHG